MGGGWETAAALEGGASSEELASIASSFVIAGSPTGVGSLWKVDDTSNAELLLAFYEKFLECGSSGALREEQLALAKGQGSRETFEHPYFWAPLVLYGFDK